MRWLILVLLMLLNSVAMAENYCNGHCEGGYTYRDGYWYDSHGQAYTRYRDKCYYNRCNWYWCWKYSPYYAAKTYKPVDWRAAVVQMAEAREAAQDKLKASQEENKAFIEAMNALGLSSGNAAPLQGLPLGGFLVAPNGKPFNTLDFRQVIQSGFNAEQGQTLFSVSQLSDIYSQNDLSVLFQQAQQLASGAQQLASDANRQFDDAVVAEAAGRQRIAEIIAKTSLVREALRNAVEPKRDERDIHIGTEDTVPIGDVSALIQAKCIRCHNTATDKNGGVDLSKYDSFTAEQKDFVFETVASGKMPKGGKRLTGKELKLFAQ
jgi:hypothetical protein